MILILCCSTIYVSSVIIAKVAAVSILNSISGIFFVSITYCIEDVIVVHRQIIKPVKLLYKWHLSVIFPINRVSVKQQPKNLLHPLMID